MNYSMLLGGCYVYWDASNRTNVISEHVLKHVLTFVNV